MQKTLKRLFILLLSAALISCIAVFAACNKNDDNDDKGGNDGTVTITVKYPDGTPVNGHTDGTKWDNDLETETNVWIQICISAGQGFESCNTPVTLGADGKITLNVQDDIISVFEGNENFTADTKFDIHVQGLTEYKEDGYGSYTKNTLPSKLDITLIAK